MIIYSCPSHIFATLILPNSIEKDKQHFKLRNASFFARIEKNLNIDE